MVSMNPPFTNTYEYLRSKTDDTGVVFRESLISEHGTVTRAVEDVVRHLGKTEALWRRWTSGEGLLDPLKKRGLTLFREPG